MISHLKYQFDTIRASVLRHHSAHRLVLADLPAGLYEFWTHNAGSQFPGIRRDPVFFMRAAEGLMDYFDCASIDAFPCALPSRAADSVWQAWVRFSPARLEAFCLKHFGRIIVRAPGALESAALARTRARAPASKAAGAVPLPPLFTLDRRLRMPRGLGFSHKQGRIYYQLLDLDGKPHGTYYFLDAPPPAITASQRPDLPHTFPRQAVAARTISANLELPFDAHRHSGSAAH